MDIRDGGLEPCKPVDDGFIRTLLKESIPESLLTRGYAVFRLPRNVTTHVSDLLIGMDEFFCKAPVEERKKFAANAPDNEIESAGYSHVAGLKEYFQARAGGPGTTLAFPGSYNGSPDFGVSVLNVYEDFDKIGRNVVQDIVKHVNITDGSLFKMLDPPPPESTNVVRSGKHVTTTLLPEDYVSSSNVDLFHYHNDESTRGKWALNHPSHSDSGIITFIPCSKVAALEFLDQKLNQWVALEALIHEYAQRKGKSYERYGLVMIGDSIQFASKNKMLAGMHRVVRTPEERFSVVYKMRGRPEICGPKYQVDYKIVPIQQKALKKLADKE